VLREIQMAVLGGRSEFSYTGVGRVGAACEQKAIA
jgi:hypothetical protein